MWMWLWYLDSIHTVFSELQCHLRASILSKQIVHLLVVDFQVLHTQPTATHIVETHSHSTRICIRIRIRIQPDSNSKADAFFFGIILLELFTNTSPTDARGVLEHCIEALTSTAVNKYHDTFELGIPVQVLARIATMVDRLTETKHRGRSSIMAELPELERICEM